MRVWIYVWARILLAATALFFVSTSAEAKTIYIAVSNPDMSFLSGGVAKYQGYFKDEGLDVEVLQMNANVSVAVRHDGPLKTTLRATRPGRQSPNRDMVGVG